MVSIWPFNDLEFFDSDDSIFRWVKLDSYFDVIIGVILINFELLYFLLNVFSINFSIIDGFILLFPYAGLFDH